jgi:F-type H+-transporting ATPase subunit epsilon
MGDQLRLEVVTPQRVLIDTMAGEVRLPAALGEMGVLPGHTPLLTSLATGPLTYFAGGAATRVAVQGGFAEVLPDRVTVLARVAETPDEIDLESARQELAAAQNAMKSASADDLDEISARLRLAETRLDVGGHASG